MKIFKIIIFGLVNYVLRFALGGFLFLGLKVNPVGFWYGFMLTAAAFVIALALFKFVIKPQSLKEGMLIALVWVLIALVLDTLTAVPIVHVNISYLFGEVQTWTRVLVIFLAALI